MKQKLIIFVVLILLAAVLVGLNAASYTQKEKTPDNEFAPNRSTFNSGTTGTQALYTLLSETGRKVTRWQQPADELVSSASSVPATFVVIGATRRPFEEAEFTGLLQWVSDGGRLVIIDREPPPDLLTTTGNWKITFEPANDPVLYQIDPADRSQMTAGMPAAIPGQPSIFTAGVNAVQPSRLLSSIKIEHLANTTSGISTNALPPPKKSDPYESENGDDINTGGETYKGETDQQDEIVEETTIPAPVILVATAGKNVLVEAPFGNGRIIYLSDPYVVSNSGIGSVDNSQLAVNMLTNGDRVIAFDEYHQGYGVNNNRFLEFFGGTPVIAIFFQCVFIAGLVFYSRSRRFGRPLPVVSPDRLSKLEYVSAMSELQRRTKAYDLAIENVYRDFRRRAARHFGVDNLTVSQSELAARLSERVKADKREIEDLIYKCEDIIAGEPTTAKKALELVKRIREIEDEAGIGKLTRR